MNWKRKVATGVAALAMAVGGMAATATSASAVGGCPAGKLCLYEDTNFVDLDVTSTSTQACIYLSHLGETGFYNGIGSYVNNLPVNAVVYHWSGSSYILDGTISPGGSSSNTNNSYTYFGDRGAVCMGGVMP
ncbi:peptidase inhibitor family I36 protein [Streptomyces sp. AM 4-1-1]|uniref:peptidase inhibitor family I36 protein n=1 Tax=Streptomyces sp. AM 4-1-1 TaxID=3028710 RepID=UPI0023B958D2|nr:peptidase inhibitor family I36 protein [Streptomyces sp. AM 4-1-1]WEH35201.1 peptidase inhibitor family I36 protein [Streptomyces sp. AM 4-1-1]